MNAQEIKVGPGLDIVTPISGDFGDAADAGFGLSVRGQVGFIDKFSIMGTLGYQSFGKKSNVRVSMIPAQFGVKYALMDAEVAKLYMSLEAGIHSIRTKVGSSTNSSSAFSFAPGLGVQIAKIDLSTKLQFMNEPDNFDGNVSYFNIRLGYMFGL